MHLPVRAVGGRLMKDLYLDEMAKLPGGYYVRREEGGYRLRRFEPSASAIVDLKLYGGPGEAFEGYVEAFAQELVLQAGGVTGDNIEDALSVMKGLVRDLANHQGGEG